jgi:outer membrane protein assembly factor BamB
VVLFDPEGTQIWNITSGGARQDEFNSLVADEDGGVVAAGQTHSQGAGDFDQWIVCLDSDGNEVWESVTGGIYNHSLARKKSHFP